MFSAQRCISMGRYLSCRQSLLVNQVQRIFLAKGFSNYSDSIGHSFGEGYEFASNQLPRILTAHNLSAAQSPEPPFPTVLIYNQSKHACQSVLADIRSVWGKKVRVIQVLEEGNQRLPGMDSTLFIKTNRWADMVHFGQRLDLACSQDHALYSQRRKRKIVFMAGWSAFAEAADTARAVNRLGLIWPGTEPTASEKLEKIGFKRICESVGAPTPPFRVLSEEGKSPDLGDPVVKEMVINLFAGIISEMDNPSPGLIKSIHGGGGKGTSHVNDPTNSTQVREAIEQVLNEMNRSDGIYFEQRVNTKGDGNFFQLELEVDGDQVAHGGRFVWFNSRLQKVVEIGLSDEHVSLFMPSELYQKAREWSAAIAQNGGNNTRATMEALVFKKSNGEYDLQFIECNRRPQVENEALAFLEQDSSGNRRYTFAELMMRAADHPQPKMEPVPDVHVVLHARWLHGNPDKKGNITYQPGVVGGMKGPSYEWVPSELLAPGEISFTADPQLGKAVIIANSWEQMCERATTYFETRQPDVQGSTSTYARTMQNLFSNPTFRACDVPSNATFSAIDIPSATRTVADILEDQVTPVLIDGYRPGEGVTPDLWPTESVLEEVEILTTSLNQETPTETAFTMFARGEMSYGEWISHLKGQLSNQGGGWVTVAPRDTAQQGMDSESAGVCSIGRQNAEIFAQQSGCVGYETGGAQYQAGLIRGFNPAVIVQLGLPYNMPSHSLQRSQYANGLAELPPTIRQPLFDATAQIVQKHYQSSSKEVPWFPYNFHAGNYFNMETNYSPQDDTTGELLRAGCTPLPNWVYSTKFSLDTLKIWTGRQIDLFEAHNRVLQQIRIKNPGHGTDWTPEAIWEHVETVLGVFQERKLPVPIIYIHNHDFNGLGGHIGRDLFLKAQGQGYKYLVIDGAYRKSGTHNDNTILHAGLNTTAEQEEALIEYNHYQQQIEKLLCRFDSRASQMTPWNSDWAGGTEGSDLRIAREYGLSPRQIEVAKVVATEVFPLERAVTPFSEYKLRLGIAIMVEDQIKSKTATEVREFIHNGGKLRVGGDVLVGLHRWETLVSKPIVVDQLLANMPEELDAAFSAQSQLIDQVPTDYTAAQCYTVLGYQQKGLDLEREQLNNLTCLLAAPHVLHRKPRTLPSGTQFSLLTEGIEQTEITFKGFGSTPNGDITVNYLHEGQSIQITTPDPDAQNIVKTDQGPRKADPSNPYDYGTIIPGEILSYSVQTGDILKAGEPLCVLESMKMEMKISVPDELDGHIVKLLPCKGRTAELQGDILTPGDLLLETEEAS